MHAHTEAGEGEDGRMKSAIGIGALLMDGLGDTIRVSLTEDPEYEIDPCRRLADLGNKAATEVCLILSFFFFRSTCVTGACSFLSGRDVLVVAMSLWHSCE